MRSYRVSTSTATATATSTSTAITSVSTSGISQPESAAGQRPQGSSFTGTPTTVHIPKSTTHIPSADQYAGLSLLAEASVSRIKVDPFEALAAHRTVTFVDGEDDEYLEQPDDSSMLSNEPSQPVEGSDPKATPCISLPTNSKETNSRTMTSISEQEILPSINDHFRRALSGTVPKAFLTAITGIREFPIRQSTAVQKTDLTNLTDWRVILTEDPKMPFKCGYVGCNKRYSKKSNLKVHFFTHTGDSPYRCHLGACAGEKFRNKQALNRHIRAQHTHEKPFLCPLCDERFGRKDTLLVHRRRHHPNAPGVKAIQLSSGDYSAPIEHAAQQDYQHLPRKHKPNPMRRYKCRICGKQFMRRDHLKHHREHVHSKKNKKKQSKPNSK